MTTTTSVVEALVPPTTVQRPTRRFRFRATGVVAATFLVAVVAACVLAGWLAPYQPEHEDLASVLLGPTHTHLLGTDELGRDVLSRLMFGGRITLIDAAEAVIAFAVVGVPVGLVSGYIGGRTDRVIMTLTDIVLSIPVIIVLLVVAAVFEGDLALMVALGVVASPSLIRVTRAVTTAVRAELYVKAAEVVGLNRFTVLRRHVLPQVFGPILVQLSVFSATAIVVEAALGYLGLDVTPPAPSWGSMVADAATVISQQPWLIVPSGCLIALTVTALGLVGDAVRQARGDRRTTTGSRPSQSRRLTDHGRRQRNAALLAGSNGPTESAPLLSVRDLSVTATTPEGEVQLLERVSFDLDRGQALGIVGESGSGKTMTALALLGLLSPGVRLSDGMVSFAGHVIHGAGGADGGLTGLRGRDIGFISQEPMVALDPVFTVGSLLSQVVRTHHPGTKRAIRAAVLKLLAQVRLPDPAAVAARYPHELSGGMAQRVCIAIALAGQPKLLIADEPTTALDVTVQAEILDLLRELREQTGMALLLVTHDWGVVADACERTAVMYAGQLVELADVGAVFSEPAHPYTEALLAANPHLVGDGPLASIPGSVPSPGQWPVGCHFAARCPYVSDDCTATAVALVTDGPGRLTRCRHPERIGQRSDVAAH